jgi:hypothetical protein
MLRIGVGRRTQVVKGEVCKTSMQRFESARRLHFLPDFIRQPPAPLIERVSRLSTKKKKEAENFGGEIAKGLGQVSRTVTGSGARWRRHLLLRPGFWPWLVRGRGAARHRGRLLVVPGSVR